MSLTVAAIGAVVAALIELTLLPHLRLGGLQPDLVLVLAVVWTLVVGFETGLVWAFVGGLMLDVLAMRPLGSTAFVLLVCVGAAAAMGRALDRAGAAGPAVVTLATAVLFGGLLMVSDRVLRGPAPVGDVVGGILPRALVDAAVGGAIGAAALWRRSRTRQRERIDW